MERGLVRMKGKGDKLTYWLLGEDLRSRSLRSDKRASRRAAVGGDLAKAALNGCVGGPRSSLKNKLARCSSLESPKRLRFGDCTEYPQKAKHQLLEASNLSSVSSYD